MHRGLPQNVSGIGSAGSSSMHACALSGSPFDRADLKRRKASVLRVLSSVVERRPYKANVGSSSLSAPTNRFNDECGMMNAE